MRPHYKPRLECGNEFEERLLPIVASGTKFRQLEQQMRKINSELHRARAIVKTARAAASILLQRILNAPL